LDADHPSTGVNLPRRNTRDRLICQRTALINHTRGLLAEYGIVLPQGPWRFTARAPAAIAGADLSDLARTIFGELLDQLDDLDPG
jgi:transposase